MQDQSYQRVEPPLKSHTVADILEPDDCLNNEQKLLGESVACVLLEHVEQADPRGTLNRSCLFGEYDLEDVMNQAFASPDEAVRNAKRASKWLKVEGHDLWSAWASERNRWDRNKNRIALTPQFWRALGLVEIVLAQYWKRWLECMKPKTQNSKARRKQPTLYVKA